MISATSRVLLGPRLLQQPHQAAGEERVELVPAAHGDHLGVQVGVDDGDVAQEVHDLVPHRLVGEVQVRLGAADRLLQGAVAAEDEGVLVRDAAAQAQALELLVVRIEAEGARRGQLLHKAVRLHAHGEGLGRAVALVELQHVADGQLVLGGGGHQCGGALGDGQRVLQGDDGALGLLLLEAGGGQGLGPFQGAAAQSGQLVAVQLDHQVVHVQARAGGQQVLGDLDLDVVPVQRGAAEALAEGLDRGGHDGAVRQVRAHEEEAAGWVRRQQAHAHALAGEEPDAGQLNGPADGPLLARHVILPRSAPCRRS